MTPTKNILQDRSDISDAHQYGDAEQSLSTRQASELLKVNPQLLRRFVRDGKLRAYGLGKGFTFKRFSVISWEKSTKENHDPTRKIIFPPLHRNRSR